MKRDKEKTKEQLVNELTGMRQRVAVLEATEVEHKQAEETLRESERRYRLLAENAEDVIWTVDMNMQPIYISPSITHLLGYSVEEAMAKPMKAVYTPASFGTAMKVLAEELAIENMEQKELFRSRTLELELNRKDGSIVPVEVKFTFIREPDGRPVEILAIARDITERKQIEEQMKESEERFRTCVETLLDGFGTFSAVRDEMGHIVDFRYEYINEAGCKLNQMTYKEQIGHTLLELLPRHKETGLFDEYVRVVETGQSFARESVFYEDVFGGNQKLNRAFDFQAVKFGDGFAVDWRDITDRKRVEEKLREAEAELKHTIEVVPGIIAKANAHTGYFTHCNLALSSILGFSSEEFLARPFIEFVHPDDRQSTINEVAKQLKGSPVARFENRYICKDGAYKWLEWRATAADETGVVYTAATDITERKQAEEALSIERDKLVNIFDSIRDPVHICNSEYDIEYANPAFLKAFGPIKDLKCHQYFRNLEEPCSFCKMEDVLSGGTFHDEVTMPKNQRSYDQLDTPLINADGSISKLEILRDITERKQAEEKEKQLQQELILSSRLASVGEMAAGIAHEINNPLTGVVGFSDLLMKKDIPEDIRKDVEIIYNGAQRVANITSRMLTYARQSKPEQTTVDINDIIKTTLAMRTYEMESSNIKVTAQLDPDLPTTTADVAQLQQVFLNIILNAEVEMINAHGRGTLSVKTERIDNGIRVSFKDDGPGITKKNMEMIFDPFFTTREVGKGAGLGLSVCHGIISQHRGKIYAQSRFGKGATFIVELPVVTKAEQLELAEPAIQPGKVSKARVLVVDDDTIVQEFLNEVLSEEGHEVEIVENGDDALERLGSEDYDVILLDIKLPGISGIELYKHLQKKAKSLAGRVIFITGDVMSRDTMGFLSKTRAPYITKPFDAEQLKKDIDRILNQQA